MKRSLLLLIFFTHLFYPIYGQQKAIGKHTNALYACLPCGFDCDHLAFDKPGTCPQCGMQLVLKKSIVFTNISPAELCKIVSLRPNVILLDVRTPNEFAGKAEEKFGHLKNAINIPIQELKTRLDELKAYRNKEVIVYCSHNHRSPRASQLLTENGFKHIKNMTGGMSVWAESVGHLAASKALLVN